MPRAGLSPASVVDAAIAVIDAGGPGALTLAAVAERTGVATPSLYKHVAGLVELRRLVALRVLDEVTERLSRAVMGRGEDAAIAALMDAYRRYATEYPGRYAALPQIPQSDRELAAAGERLVDVFLAVLRGYALRGPAAIHATRCLRAAAHGFASLQVAGAFARPESLDTTYEQLITILTAGLHAVGSASGR